MKMESEYKGRRNPGDISLVYHSSTERVCLHVLLEQFNMCLQLYGPWFMAIVENTP